MKNYRKFQVWDSQGLGICRAGIGMWERSRDVGTGSKRPGKNCYTKKTEEAKRQRQKIQKDLKPENYLVIAKITFWLCLREPERP